MAAALGAAPKVMTMAVRSSLARAAAKTRSGVCPAAPAALQASVTLLPTAAPPAAAVTSHRAVVLASRGEVDRTTTAHR